MHQTWSHDFLLTVGNKKYNTVFVCRQLIVAVSEAKVVAGGEVS